MTFPFLKTGVVYLDTAASAQKPSIVIETEKEFYEKSYSNVHRGIHRLAEKATEAYENARRKVANLVGANTIVFTSGTTQGINIVANSLVPTFDSGNMVVSIMEHHSNFVPWQQLAEKQGLELRIIPLTPDFKLDMDEVRKLIDENTRIVAVTHVSNVLGTINPIKELTELAHSKGSLILVDGAQAVPHMKVDVTDLDVDFYAFSGHKMYGPSGIGALYGKKELLKSMQPPNWGGEMVKDVTIEKTSWNDVPWKFEPGTPNIAGAVGMGAAAEFLDYESLNEGEVTCYALEQLEKVEGLAIIGPKKDRGGAISFTLSGVHPHDVAQVLDEKKIAVRAGHHCAQPLHCSLGIDATTRASIGMYNTKTDIDKLVEALKEAKEVFS